MKFITDFHIHSHFSIATSGNLVPEHLEYWARLKGIDVVGTGDCVHPGWLDELREKLEPAGNGLYRLRESCRLDESRRLAGPNIPGDVHFMLTGEISNIYKKNGKVRKVHNLCVFPDFDAAVAVQKRLDRMGNIRSDGRPILGLDSKILLELVLDSSDRSYLIPCHIWTPWFSVLGSRSGFDSIEECYDDLTDYIFALETGLSSDPPMNRACSMLDRYRLVSNSDAHSPEKLGREANRFDAELGYDGILKSLRDGEGFLGTIEFFPQEGKYHYDGHRKCGIRWDPLETVKHGAVCPVCGRPVTKGVMYRVAELADRREPGERTEPFQSITALPDLIAELLNQKSGKSVKVMKEYHRLIGGLGSEFYILLDAPLDELRSAGGELIAEAIRRLRNGDVFIDEGYDGEFGRIKVFREGEVRAFSGTSLFVAPEGEAPAHAGSSLTFDIEEFRSLRGAEPPTGTPRLLFELPGESTGRDRTFNLTDGQRAGIEHGEGPCMVIAGPGTGKTGVLTRRILHLVRNGGVPPERILAVTFTNKAAAEMRGRIQRLMPAGGITISTFHALGLGIIRENSGLAGRTVDFFIADEDDIREIMAGIVPDERKIPAAIRDVSAVKQGITGPGETKTLLKKYDDTLRSMNAIDLDDCIAIPAGLLRKNADLLRSYRERFQWIMVDEFQDINAVQYEFLTLLAGPGSPNLFMIGDPDQAIYGFRGSDAGFMDRIAKEYPGMTVVRLDRSFRCPDPVMRAAGQILMKGSAPAGRDIDGRVHIREMPSDRSEADWIAASIEAAIGGVRSFSMESGISDGEATADNRGFSDFAVLCRSSFLFDALTEAFGNHGIPYQTSGTESMLGQEPYRQAVRSLKKIFYTGKDTSLSLGVISDIWGMIKKGDRVADVLKFIMVILEAPEEAMSRLTSFAELFGGGYHEFFRACSLRMGADDRDERAEAVSIMTIHASKGLEFDTVFIPGCEKGIIPFELFGAKEGSEMEEEVRLFYVGITRTINNLYLTHAKKRSVKGRILNQVRSPLLDRLEEALLKRGTREPRKKSGSDDMQLDLFK